MVTTLGALRILDPEKWAKTIRKAVKANHGRVDDAAIELGVSRRTLFLWLKESEFDDLPRAPTGVRRDRMPE